MISMDEAHSEDYRVKALFDDAHRALRAVLDDAGATGRLSEGNRGLLTAALAVARDRAVEIMWTWS